MRDEEVLSRITFRPPEHADLNMIVDSFTKQITEGSLVKGTDRVILNVNHLCSALCKRGGSAVAALSKAPNVLIGWAAKEDDGALLFAYVKHDFRRWGIGSAMIQELTKDSPIRVVYWTRAAKKIYNSGKPVTWDWARFNNIQDKKGIV